MQQHSASCPSGTYLAGLVLDVRTDAGTADPGTNGQWMVLSDGRMAVGVLAIICQYWGSDKQVTVPVYSYVQVGAPVTIAGPAGMSLVAAVKTATRDYVQAYTRRTSGYGPPRFGSPLPSTTVTKDVVSTDVYSYVFRDPATGAGTVVAGVPAYQPPALPTPGSVVGVGVSFGAAPQLALPYITTVMSGLTINVAAAPPVQQAAPTAPAAGGSYLIPLLLFIAAVLLVIYTRRAAAAGPRPPIPGARAATFYPQ